MWFEKISLQRCIKILKDYPKVIVKPNTLELSFLRSYLDESFEVEDFPPTYFEGFAGYNRLMLSSEFYKRFADNEYILICQLDAYVFEDKLTEWCLKGYDYIGAPWVKKRKYKSVYYQFYRTTRKLLYRLLRLYNHDELTGHVGNGGLSLRKTETCLKITSLLEQNCPLKFRKELQQLNEDVFWSLRVPVIQKDFNVPSWQEALEFAFDNRVKECFYWSHGRLPFGIHGWHKHLDDYKDFIEEMEKEI